MRTFDEWTALGYRIKRGSKAVGRNAQGVPVFSEDQVWDPKAKRSYGLIILASDSQYDYWDVDYDDPLTYDNWMDK